jgi:hypothetical protein
MVLCSKGAMIEEAGLSLTFYIYVPEVVGLKLVLDRCYSNEVPMFFLSPSKEML